MRPDELSQLNDNDCIQDKTSSTSMLENEFIESQTSNSCKQLQTEGQKKEKTNLKKDLLVRESSLNKMCINTDDRDIGDHEHEIKLGQQTQRSSAIGDLKHKVKFSNETLFLAACATGDIGECERLLDSKLITNINITHRDNLTGLHEATIAGNANMVKFLLDKGADIDCCDSEAWTPLHAAARMGRTEIVKILLNRGADVTKVNCDNQLAYDLSRNDDIKGLIGFYLDDIDEQTLDELRRQEELSIRNDIEFLLKQTDKCELIMKNVHPITKATILHVIAAKGYIELLKLILETNILREHADLEARDIDGFTPLLAASFWSQAEVIHLLISHGADSTVVAYNGYQMTLTSSIGSD